MPHGNLQQPLDLKESSGALGPLLYLDPPFVVPFVGACHGFRLGSMAKKALQIETSGRPCPSEKGF